MMNLDPLSFSLKRIENLVSGLDRKLYLKQSEELVQILSNSNLEEDRHLLRCLLSYIDFTTEKTIKDSLQVQFLGQNISRFISKSNFSSILCFALENPFHFQKGLRPSAHFLNQLCKVLKLNKLQEVEFGIAFLESTNQELVVCATHFLKHKLPDFIRSYTETDFQQSESNFSESSVAYLLEILRVLSVPKIGIPIELKQSFVTALKTDFPKARVPVVLAPFLYNLESASMDRIISDGLSMPKAIPDESLCDVMLELGYNCCSNSDECRRVLTEYGIANLSSQNVAKVISMMARTHANLSSDCSLLTINTLWAHHESKDGVSSTWDYEVFIKTVQELCPSLNWQQVVYDLDHPNFIIQDVQGLKLIVNCVNTALKDKFPIDCLYRRWKNTKGQLSWLEQALRNSDVFCLTDYPCTLAQLSETENFKGDAYTKKPIAIWRNLELLQTLLYLAENCFYEQVRYLFQFPVKQYPDVLLVSLLQTDSSYSPLKCEIISNILPLFIDKFPNSLNILKFVWSKDNISKSLFISALTQYYMSGDSSDHHRLSRMTELIAELNAIFPTLMQAKPPAFAIDLAVMVAFKDYLNWEKWLNDKINADGENFIVELIKYFLNKHQFLTQRSFETFTFREKFIVSALDITFSVLQQISARLPYEIIENIKTLFSIARPLIQKFKLEFNEGGRVDEPSPTQLFHVGSTGLGVSPLSGSSSFNAVVGPAPSAIESNSFMRSESESPYGVVPPGVEVKKQETVLPGNVDMLQRKFSKEVEDEANAYFVKIYNQQNSLLSQQHGNQLMSIDEVLEILKKFKVSGNQREMDVFTCVIRNLLEEYRFFHQYPEKELDVTATFFGGVIAEGLVSFYPLGLALRYVMDALKKRVGNKMYKFGITALDRFKSNLADYPDYCARLAMLENFKSFPPDIVQYINYGKDGQLPPTRPDSLPPAPIQTPILSGTPNSLPVSSGQPSIASTNIDTLVAAAGDLDVKPEEPPAAVQDKVAFIFNNLSQVNISQKVEEMKEIIINSAQSILWFARYMVLKRASIEINFHSLYASFLELLQSNELIDAVLMETFRNIKVLLTSDKSGANFSDRSLLKNLGHWLGTLTLSRNKPVLQSHIDLKSLVVEAARKGTNDLVYVVPFVAKVLEGAAKSRIFRPPNPWTLALLNTLAELHRDPDLKINLKFEVEVLCRSLNIEISKLSPTNLLKNHAYQITPQLSVSKKNDTDAMRSSALALTHPQGGMVSKPLYTYNEISTYNTNGIAQHIVINHALALFQSHPHLKSCVRQAIERSLHDLLVPVMERSIKIALTTCEHIIKKDFALDPEESKMRLAAQHMVKNFTAAMAMITCKEPLMVSVTNNLKNGFLNNIRNHNSQTKEIVDLAAATIAQENNELCCCFLQKSAVEKALPEIDKKLATEYELRKHARIEGRRYCDSAVLTYQAERMPEQIRLRVGGVSATRLAVYEEFARNIPGFLTQSENDLHGFSTRPAQPYATDDITQIYNKMVSELEQHIKAAMQSPTQMISTPMRNLLESVIVARNSREIVTALTLLQKTVESLMAGLGQIKVEPEMALRFRDCHLLILKGLQDQRAYGPMWTNKNVTKVLCEGREEFRHNVDAVDCLIRNRLVNMHHYDAVLAQWMDNGLNFNVVNFAMHLVKRYLFDENSTNALLEAKYADLYHTVDALNRVAQQPTRPDGLLQLMELVRGSVDSVIIERSGAPLSMMHSGISQAREFDDPPGLRDKTEQLLREWVTLYHSPHGGRESTKAFSTFVSQMHHQGILKTDDLITRFFRLCTETCVDLCYRALNDQSAHNNPSLTRARCYHTLDAFVRLIALLVRHSGETANAITKINLLNKVLGIITGVLLQDHEMRNRVFQQLPYHRTFIMLLLELCAPDDVLESINFQVLTAFSYTFHLLRPSKAPAFAYAWLELISHRIFIARMLQITPQQKGWAMYAQLLVDLFKFFAPFLRNNQLTKPTQLLYKGTLRVLLVLLHDFPEFLCDYHYGFCDVIPPNCIQMRNLILSAFPRHMRLPDPFMPDLKVDLLKDIASSPRILTNFTTVIPQTLKKNLDSYLKSRSPVTFLTELRGHLQVSNEPGMRYNITLMNALVLYVGTQAISYIQSMCKVPVMGNITHSPHMDVYQNLAIDLDTEGRYLFLNAIANHLRYPNSHTHYFSCTLLYLFAEANTEAIQEQITRVLLERVIVNRPHPWGLLITFIELINNPNFKFWSHEFVRCAPEIEKLFDSVAKSCTQRKESNSVSGVHDISEH